MDVRLDEEPEERENDCFDNWLDDRLDEWLVERMAGSMNESFDQNSVDKEEKKDTEVSLRK